ncbi:MAG TPA: hypothetical protein VM681_05075 [Candidatus Thermoplasmatota archaeon]|nr:hypothetical protein [Candidatus Thermoplasmatota archaeon]
MHCAQCGESLAAGHRFCPQCAAPVPGASAAPARLHIDELSANCHHCGQEGRYGDLRRCGVCHERFCVTCVAECSECKEAACPACILECTTCGKVGCADDWEHCESCHARAMCKEHAEYCSDCGYPACRQCLSPCKKCGDDVCGMCVEEGHGTAK